MNKKRIFGIILFILIGFFMFTFANPNEEVNDEDKKPKTEEKTKKEKKGMDVVKPAVIEKEETTNLDVIQSSVVVNNQKPTENNIPSTQPIDNSKELEKALELEHAKKKAVEELESYKKDYDYTDSTVREVIVKEYTDAIKEAKDVSDVDRLLNDAESKIDELVKADIANYINAAIEDIKKYASYDEQYISEITDEKDNGIAKLNKIKETDLEDIDYKNIKEEIDGIVEVTNGNIDEIIENKTFKVTFVGKNNVKEEQTINYKKAAKAPTTVKFNNPVYKDVTYEITGFDKEFSEVKSDLTVNALYKITNIKATIYLNNQEMPNPKTKTVTGAYTKLGTVNLKLDNEKINNSILNDKNANVYTNDNDFDITTLFNDSLDVPELENAYDYYEYYVVKFVAGNQAGIHIDCVKLHDSLKELTDAKERLNDLINSLPVNCNQTYTSATCSVLDKTVNDSKNASTLSEVENAITEITNAKNNLVEIVLDHITLSLNSDTYYLNGDKATLKVEAFYNDETKNGEISNYTTITSFDNTSVGSRDVKVSYTFNGVIKEASVPYKVIYTDEQLEDKTAKIGADIDWNVVWDKTSWWPHVSYISGIEFTIEFNNVDEDVEAAYIHKTTQNIFTNNDEVIKLNKTDNKNIFNVSFEDYNRLWSNNTLFAGQNIYVTYKVGNQTYTQKYKESFGKLKRA